jgi:hypothetical protein
MGRLDDAFALAESGSWGTLDEVQAELVKFLSEWIEDTAESDDVTARPRE